MSTLLSAFKLPPLIFTPTFRCTLSIPTPTLPAIAPAAPLPSVILMLPLSAAFAFTVPPASISLPVILTVIAEPAPPLPAPTEGVTSVSLIPAAARALPAPERSSSASCP